MTPREPDMARPPSIERGVRTISLDVFRASDSYNGPRQGPVGSRWFAGRSSFQRGRTMPTTVAFLIVLAATAAGDSPTPRPAADQSPVASFRLQDSHGSWHSLPGPGESKL